MSTSTRKVIQEVFVDFPCPPEKLSPPRHVRSTLIGSSLRTLRERQLFDTYLTFLDPLHRTTLLESVAGVWLPIDAGIAHYRACDALDLSAATSTAIGREVGARIHGTFLGTMLRAARSAGVTPWRAFSYSNKLYERLFDGGGCRVLRTGPKDATMECAGNALAGVPYFRRGMMGLWQVALEQFCQRAHLVATGGTPTSFKVDIAWA